MLQDIMELLWLDHYISKKLSKPGQDAEELFDLIRYRDRLEKKVVDKVKVEASYYTPNTNNR